MSTKARAKVRKQHQRDKSGADKNDKNVVQNTCKATATLVERCSLTAYVSKNRSCVYSKLGLVPSAHCATGTISTVGNVDPGLLRLCNAPSKPSERRSDANQQRKGKSNKSSSQDGAKPIWWNRGTWYTYTNRKTHTTTTHAHTVYT